MIIFNFGKENGNIKFDKLDNKEADIFSLIMLKVHYERIYDSTKTHDKLILIMS